MPAMKRAGELPLSAETSAPKGARQAPTVHDQLDVDTIYKGTLMQQYLLFAGGKLSEQDESMARSAITASTSSSSTSCSGSGMAEVAHDLLFRSLGGTPYLCHSCKIIGFKREHLGCHRLLVQRHVLPEGRV